MARLDSLNGVSRVSDHYYEITGDVLVGAGIDDLKNSFIRVRSGRLRFGNGCNTVFDRCFFNEASGTDRFGSDNYSGNNACRFKGDKTCAPVFKGCKWVVDTASFGAFGRSDFDIGGTAAPRFEKSEDGAKCKIVIEGSGITQFNHFASSNVSIDGLVIDDRRSGGDMEFQIPPENVNDFRVIDNNPGSSDRHLVVLMNLWPANTTKVLRKVSARNIACWQGDSTKVIQIENPVGDIVKATDTGDSQAGVLEILRTYQLVPFALDQNSAVSAKVTITQGTTVVHDVDSNAFAEPLFQHRQAAGTSDITTNNSYRRAACVWGYEYAVRQFNVQWSPATPEGVNDGNVLLKRDAGITKTFAQAGALNQCLSLADIYDAVRYFEMTRSDRQNAGSQIAQLKGDAIGFDGVLTLVDGSNANPVQLSGNNVTVYVGTLASSKFKAFDAAIKITSQADADRLSGLRIVGKGKLSVDMPPNSELELNNITFDSPLHVESTNALTVINKGGSNASVVASGISIVALVKIKGSGFVSGSRVLVKVAGQVVFNDTMTSQSLDVDYQYSSDVSITVDVRNGSGVPAYIPWSTSGLLTKNGFAFTANQVEE